MARIGNKKAFTIHLSDEMAAMIDLKRKEWGLRSRGEVIQHLLGWMIKDALDHRKNEDNLELISKS